MTGGNCPLRATHLINYWFQIYCNDQFITENWMHFPQAASNFACSKQPSTPVAENNLLKLDMTICLKTLLGKKSGDTLEWEILILRMRFPEAQRQAVIENLSSGPKPSKWVTLLCQKLFTWRLYIFCYFGCPHNKHSGFLWCTYFIRFVSNIPHFIPRPVVLYSKLWAVK